MAALGMACALLVLAVPATAFADDDSLLPRTSTEQAPAPRPLVVVRPLGPVTSPQLRLACRSVLEALPVRCAIGAPVDGDVYAHAWDRHRRQMDARQVLEKMFWRRTGDAHVEVLVTSHDLFHAHKPYVFGLASLTDRLAVVSTARIAGPAPGGHDNFERRLRKLVLHEVGHTLGLKHDEDRSCVMRTDADVRSLDTAPEALCDHNRHSALGELARMKRTGSQALDRARGLLARGHHDEALERLRLALARGPVAPAVLADAAASFVSVGRTDDAIWMAQRALRQAPDLAEGHATLGVALQLRASQGDQRAAIRHLRRAVELRPNWKAAHAHLARLEARAQGPEN